MAENDIAIRVGADVSDLKKELSKGAQSLDKFRSGVNDGAKATLKYSAAAVAAGAAIATHLVKESLDAIDAQAKMAQQLGTSSESLAVLQRAGELSGVSMQQISVASRTLTVRLGEVANGSGEAVDAFKRLKLDANDLAKLPLDERIDAINKAMIENIPVTERAAIAAKLFGTRASTAMKMLDSGTLKTAREEAELFGVAISDVDAAQVEAANDAMSTIGVALKGVITQATIQLAPILKAIADLFKKNAKEAGGLGNSVGEAFNHAIDAVGFFADAIHGLDVIFAVVANSIIVGISGLAEGISQSVEGLLMIADAIPGVDMSAQLEQVREFKSLMHGVADEGVQAIHDKLAEPLPSKELKKFVAEAQEIAKEQAETTVANREEELENVITHQTALTAEEIKAARERVASAEREAKEKTSAIASFQNNLTSLMGSGSKKQFEIGKKASLAIAVVAGYESAVSSYAAGAKIGGPYLGAAYAAASIAATGVQISAIKAQEFGGGANTSQRGAAGGVVSAPQAESSSIINVTGINSADIFSGDQIIDMINQATENGAQLRLS